MGQQAAQLLDGGGGDDDDDLGSLKILGGDFKL
jgi:hypothetical protein